MIKLIGANRTNRGGYNFYFRSKAGWKYEMYIFADCSNGAEDIFQIAPSMTESEYIALPNQESNIKDLIK